MIKQLSNFNVDVSEIPELVVISQHLEEYYPEKEIYLIPTKNNSGNITAGYYMGIKSMILTYSPNRAYIRRIRHRQELVNKLTILGMDVR